MNKTQDIAKLLKLVKTGTILLHELFEHEIGLFWESFLHESC